MSMIYLGLMVCCCYVNICIETDTTPGAKRKCDELAIPLLGDIPLHPQICKDADAGKPTVVANPGTPQGMAFVKIIERLKTELGLG